MGSRDRYAVALAQLQSYKTCKYLPWLGGVISHRGAAVINQRQPAQMDCGEIARQRPSKPGVSSLNLRINRKIIKIIITQATSSNSGGG